jgi:hypothetical protein
MSDWAQWSRRDTLAAGIVSAVAALGARWLPTSTAVGTITNGSMVYTLFPDLHHARSLSWACLRLLPVTVSAERLYASIVPADRPDVENVVTIAELRRSIKERVRRDFDVGDTVQVDGWVLSITESRLYALAALPSVCDAILLRTADASSLRRW